MSASNGVTATCAHLLIERGQLELDAPVARYWSEFAAAGKAAITVRQLLAHTAGLAPPPASSAADVLDWERMTKHLANMAPQWRPGEAFAYHAVSFGWLVGEIVRRVTGRRVGQVIASEIAEPLGLDLWLDLPEDLEERVAPQFAPDGNAQDEAQNRLLNSREGHVAQIPAGNVIANARALARFYASLIGPVDGLRLIGEAGIDSARTAQTDDLPYFAPLAPPDGFRHPLRFGLGFELHRSGAPLLGSRSFGHTGSGGRLGWADPESGIALGFNVNSMSWKFDEGPDPRWTPWLEALTAIAATNG